LKDWKESIMKSIAKNYEFFTSFWYDQSIQKKDFVKNREKRGEMALRKDKKNA